MFARRPKKRPSGPLRPYSPEKIERFLIETRARFEVISFDVFDTLLFRRVESPEVVLERICDATVPTLVPFGWKGNGRDLLQLRREIEDKQRLEAESRGFDQEARLDDILPELYEQCGGAAAETEENRQWVREALAREIEYETDALAPIPTMQRLFHRLKEDGAKLVLTSDMYLSEPAIRRLLEANGYDLSEVPVYVSSETLLNKGSGRLFQHWMDLHAVEPRRTAHVGDHHWADVTAPDRLGIASYWLHDPAKPLPRTMTLQRRFAWSTASRWGKRLLRVMSRIRHQFLQGPCNAPHGFHGAVSGAGNELVDSPGDR